MEHSVGNRRTGSWGLGVLWLGVFVLLLSACSPADSPADDASAAPENAANPNLSEDAPAVTAEASVACPAPRRMGDGAHRVALVTRFGAGQADAVCIAFDDPELTAYAILQRSGMDLVSQYHAAYDSYTVCRLSRGNEWSQGCSFPDDDCFCDPDGAFWSFWRWQDGGWAKSQVGLANVVLTDGELFAQHWTASGDQPPTCTYADVCGSSTSSD